MRTIGIIPARCGSKGIPKKNIRLLAGKPLIAYTIEAAHKSKLDRVVVSTDCDETAKIAESLDAETVMRPEELARDDTPTLPALLHAIDTLNEEFDAAMVLQPTSPLRTSKHIDEALDLFISDPACDSLVSVVEVPHNFMPEKLMYLNDRYIKAKTPGVPKRRQEIETLYARNGAAIYISRIDLLKEGKVFGERIVPYFMKKIESFDIDDMEDWEIVEKIID